MLGDYYEVFCCAYIARSQVLNQWAIYEIALRYRRDDTGTFEKTGPKQCSMSADH
jgi:hypothetical protein